MAFPPKMAFDALTMTGSTTRKANASTSPMSKTNAHSETRLAPTLTPLKKWVACFGLTWVLSPNPCCPDGMVLWPKVPLNYIDPAIASAHSGREWVMTP